MENLSGITIKGYELLERIGAGGFGAVYRAYQTTVSREVAIKIILPGHANKPDFIRRFESEAQIIARLEHMHIVPLIDFWRDPDGAYLVMRYFRGGSLHDALQNGSFALEAAGLLLGQVTSALSVAHRNNIIHRDLKPANILLDEDGNAYLADFGIAKDLGNVQGITKTGDFVGSLDYISPEQARNEPVTPRTDIYSLGVVLYEMLVGQHPFHDVSSVERMYKHLNDPLPELTHLAPDLGDAINNVIQKATVKNPAHRFADVLALASAFRDAAALSLLIGDSVVEKLTLREQEVLQCIVEGLSNKEIAQKLFVTMATVKWHIRQLYRKLGVRSRVQAIVRARELNLLVFGEATVIGASGVAVDSIISTSMLPEPENPYKGLRAFQAADHDDFFGREALIDRLVAQLVEDGDLSRFLAVVGPSGSGKSSLVKAGLIPALWRGDLPGSERWFIVDMLPGARPLDELEVALTRVAANQSSNLHEQLQRDEYGLLRVAGLILPDDGSELVVVIDQFEEVFTLVEDEATRAHFLALLHAAVIEPRSRVRVVVTMRADFYDRPLRYPGFGELVRDRMETIMPLSVEELERAIVHPSKRVGVKFEDGLVPAIIEEVHYQPGGLPLLQYALTELFEQRENRTLTHEAYQSIGGTVGALAGRADEIYGNLDEAGQEMTRQMFLRLVTLGEGVEDTRRRVNRSELQAVTEDADLMDEVIDTYAAYRLLSLDNDPATRSPTVEVGHEAILREWERLRGWLNEYRDEIRLQRQLSHAVAEWHEAGQDASYLVRGMRLEQFEGWTAETDLALTLKERGFLEASFTERERQGEIERKQQAREAALEKRSRRVLQALVVVFLLAAVISVGLALIAFDREGQAQEAHAHAEREAEVNHSLVLANSAGERLEAGQTDLALALALEAVNIDQPPFEAERALREMALGPGSRAVLGRHSNSIRDIVFSPNARLALSDSCAELSADDACVRGELILWDAEAETELRYLEGHTDWVNGVSFGSDGQTALSGSGDSTLILWDVVTGDIIRRFTGHTGGINSIAMSQDGQTVLSGSSDGTLILWEVVTGEIIRRFEGHTDAVRSVTFSPDEQTIASGSNDAALILWDADTGAAIHEFEGHDSAVRAVVFSPDGTAILSGSDDFTLRLWNVETGAEIRRSNLSQEVRNLAVSPDGRSALVCYAVGVTLWDIEHWQPLQNLADKSTDDFFWTDAAAASSDGHLALSGTSNGVVYLWNLGVSSELRRFETDGTPLVSIVIGSEGSHLLTGTIGEDAILWDIERGAAIRRFAGDQELSAWYVALSPDGRDALVGSWDLVGGTGAGSLVLWNVETGAEIRRFEGHEFLPRSMAFSPDGRTMLSGSMQYGSAWTEWGGGELFLWDIEAGEQIRQFENTEDVTAITFSADGTRVLTSSSVKNMMLWDTTTGQSISRYDYRIGVLDVVFGPNEDTVLAATADGNLILWDFMAGEEVRRFVGHEVAVWDLDISPDGHHVISGADDGLIILWDFETGRELRRFTGHTAPVWGVVFSPDGQTAYSSSFDGALIEWQISDWSMEEVLDWVQDNRYMRDFTCEERAQYRIEPLCEGDAK